MTSFRRSTQVVAVGGAARSRAINRGRIRGWAAPPFAKRFSDAVAAGLLGGLSHRDIAAAFKDALATFGERRRC